MRSWRVGASAQQSVLQQMRNITPQTEAPSPHRRSQPPSQRRPDTQNPVDGKPKVVHNHEVGSRLSCAVCVELDITLHCSTICLMQETCGGEHITQLERRVRQTAQIFSHGPLRTLPALLATEGHVTSQPVSNLKVSNNGVSVLFQTLPLTSN